MTTFLLTILFWATPPLPGLPLKQHPSFILSWRWYLRGRLGPFGRVPPHPSWVSPTCIRGIQWHAHLYIYWKRPWCWRRLKAEGEDWRQKEKRVAEDEMVGWYQQLNGHEFELQEIVKDREAWYAADHRVTKSRTRLSYWTTTTINK